MTTRLCLLGPDTLPEGADDALLDLVDEVEIVRGSWGWALHGLSHDSTATLSAQVAALAARLGCDHAVVTGALATQPPQLIVTDVDSTLTTTEAIDLLAEVAGTGAEVATITERAMAGELDFAESLAARVATLAGLPEKALADVVPQITLSPGARELVTHAHAIGARVGVVSGGFTALVQPLVDDLGIDLAVANGLEVADGHLTGRTAGPVVDRAFKATQLTRWAAQLGVPLDLTIGVGDGANDLDLLAGAGLGVAYCAKPVTAAAADVSITFPRLDAVIGLLATRAPSAIHP